jgi:AAA+ ATPase superfamily predicted ATPase
MLYILGGASRTGKSTIARKFVVEKHTPFFCSDFLINALVKFPELSIHHDLPFIEKAEKIWPGIESLLAGLVVDEPRYLFEGDGMLPKNIAQLQERFGDSIRTCFIGFADISPEEKMKQIKTYNTNSDDWIHKYSDEELMQKVEGMVTFSHYLRSECETYRIPYFDCSSEFEKCREDVYQYLAG